LFPIKSSIYQNAENKYCEYAGTKEVEYDNIMVNQIETIICIMRRLLRVAPSVHQKLVVENISKLGIVFNILMGANVYHNRNITFIALIMGLALWDNPSRLLAWTNNPVKALPLHLITGCIFDNDFNQYYLKKVYRKNSSDFNKSYDG
jgi:hypothetical protein